MIVNVHNLAEATKQDVFDTIARHLLTQREPSASEDGETCLYFGPDGKRCAAGCLLTEPVGSKLNDEPWGRLVDAGVASPHHRALIERLQSIHDDATCRLTLPLMVQWPLRLRALAGELGLSDSVIAEMEGAA
jgi:hypothetical protein